MPLCNFLQKAKMKINFKKDRFSEKILQDANLLLRKEFKDPRLNLVSFTRIQLNDDYSVVNLYWDTYNSEDVKPIDEAMKKVSSKLRSHMAQNLKLRNVPYFNLRYDSQFADENKITELLENSQIDSLAIVEKNDETT
jgi:ribosome-binding factor A